MQENKNKFIILAVVILAVIAYFVFDNKSEEVTISPNTNATTTIPLDFGGSTNGDYTIERLPDGGTESVPIPDLNRKVVFGGTTNFDDATKKIITEKIIEIQNKLKKDSRDLASWLDLGLYQKIAGDFQGAVTSWKYVSDVSTTDFISLGNLGDMYAYYLKDKNLSETYYKRAIKNGPEQAYLYIQLAGVYKDVFKDLSKTNAIIDEGIKKMPEDKSLIQYKASLQ